MRKLVFVIIICVISMPVFSQFQKHDIIAGGSIEYNKQVDYYLLFGIEGQVGYYLTDKISVGTRLAISDAKLDGENTLFDFNPYVRYNIINRRYQVHVGTGGLMQFGNTTWRSDNKRVFKPSLSLGAGFLITDNFMIDIIYDTYHFSKYVKQWNVDQTCSIFFIARL